jgi:membrane protease YdiL (CAAX protease family)
LADREKASADEFTLLARAPSPAIADLWVSLLEAGGIHAYVPGTFLADDWAASQRVMGNIGADVFVPRGRLKEARGIVAQHPIDAGSEPEPMVEDLDAELPAAAPAPAPPLAAPRSRRSLLFEILAVCGVIVVPIYFANIRGLVERGLRPWSWPWDLAYGVWVLAYAVPQIVLLRWVISRSGEPASSFGWARFRPIRDLLLGAALLCGWIVLSAITQALVSSANRVESDSALVAFLLGRARQFPPEIAGVLGGLVYVASTVASAFVEELSMRGYLLTRLRTLLGSRSQAIVISSAVWAGGHLYQGLLPVGTHFLEGLVIGWAFSKLGRLWPFALAHAALNVVLDYVS